MYRNQKSDFLFIVHHQPDYNLLFNITFDDQFNITSMKIHHFLTFILSMISMALFAQTLKPGFDKEEYLEMLRITQYQIDTPFKKLTVPQPLHHRLEYRSPVVGMKNRWDLWTNGKNDAVISIRGSVGDMLSWLENGYAAMVPAQGSLKIADDYTFDYHLSDNPRASVHTGWLTGLAFLSRDILFRLDSCIGSGMKQFYLVGHSQGGAINYMLTAYLYDLRKKGRIPADVKFKTYCSAAPKPGNLYFAYDYEYMTRNGWAFNVVNSVDWVPEVPFSIQTNQDFNAVNPFTDAKKMIKKQKFPINILLGMMYSQLMNPPVKAVKNYKKNLGKRAHKMINRSIPSFQMPSYVDNCNYVRTGTTILLYADADYAALFLDSKTNIFCHHFIEPYYYLAQKSDY